MIRHTADIFAALMLFAAIVDIAFRYVDIASRVFAMPLSPICYASPLRYVFLHVSMRISITPDFHIDYFH